MSLEVARNEVTDLFASLRLYLQEAVAGVPPAERASIAATLTLATVLRCTHTSGLGIVAAHLSAIADAEHGLGEKIAAAPGEQLIAKVVQAAAQAEPVDMRKAQIKQPGGGKR